MAVVDVRAVTRPLIVLWAVLVAWLLLISAGLTYQASRLNRLEVIIDGVFSGGNKVEPK